jgi:uncharacterized membrane protein
LRAETASDANAADWLASLAAFKAVLLEGTEVVFIVLAVGARPGLLAPAALGAAAACVLVLTIGALLRRPLTRVPENTLKFLVGGLLTGFGVFWSCEGLGAPWPGGDWQSHAGLAPAGRKNSGVGGNRSPRHIPRRITQ